jgi:membrane protease YdiL (CAAX protease family)
MLQPLINKGFKPLSQIAVLLGVLGVSMIAAGLASVVIAMGAKMPMGDPESMMQEKYAPALRIMQVMSTIILFGLPAILYAFICYKNGWAALGLNKSWILPVGIVVIATIIATAPVTDALGIINKAIPLPANWRAYFDSMESTYESQVKLMLDVGSAGGLMISLFLVAALPALVEELFFRGALQGMLSRWIGRPWVAIMVTSVIFSAIHLSWYGFLPRAMLGMVLGAVFYITGNLWYSVLMHFINNAAAVVYLYALQQQGKPLDMSQTTVFPIWAGALAAVVVVLLVWWLRQIHPPVLVKEIMDDRRNPFTNPSGKDLLT